MIFPSRISCKSVNLMLPIFSTSLYIFYLNQLFHQCIYVMHMKTHIIHMDFRLRFKTLINNSLAKVDFSKNQIDIWKTISSI